MKPFHTEHESFFRVAACNRVVQDNGNRPIYHVDTDPYAWFKNHIHKNELKHTWINEETTLLLDYIEMEYIEAYKIVIFYLICHSIYQELDFLNFSNLNF